MMIGRVSGVVAKQVPSFVRSFSNPANPLRNQSIGEGYSLPNITGKVLNAAFFGVTVISVGIATGPKTDEEKAKQRTEMNLLPGGY